MKILYIILVVLGILVIFIASGCSIYYPTSYRAFIPKKWDKDYKEYQRLCKENLGKIVYAEPVSDELVEEIMEKGYVKYDYFQPYLIPINKSIYENRVSVYKLPLSAKTQYDVNAIAYQIVFGYTYDRHWTEFIPITKGSAFRYEKLTCAIDWSKILQKSIANKEYIGSKNDIMFRRYGSFDRMKDWE